MNIVFYLHGGCDNRGCEAIVRSSVAILYKSEFGTDITVFSAHPEEDVAVELDKMVKLQHSPTRAIPEIPFIQRAFASIYNRLFHSEKIYYLLTSKPFHDFDFTGTVALSIGGDHYCYKGGEQTLAFHNARVRKKNGISVLWGCSVEPFMLEDCAVMQDMALYNLIVARESITYDALRNAGLDNVVLHPDPAFALSFTESDCSRSISENTVGVNLSPYALGAEQIGMENYRKMLLWILEHTNMDILLIPHVFKAHSNDTLLLKRLHSFFAGEPRIKIVQGKPAAEELKGIIRKCRFYVGARTHSTIAAYSSCVPTLVIGYSVKAQGIAKDIFGTSENYVVSVQHLQNDECLSRAFQWMYEHEKEIRQHLIDFMPLYIADAYKMGRDLLKICVMNSLK